MEQKGYYYLSLVAIMVRVKIKGTTGVFIVNPITAGQNVLVYIIQTTYTSTFIVALSFMLNIGCTTCLCVYKLLKAIQYYFFSY